MPELRIGSKRLRLGRDYVPAPQSGPAQGSAHLYFLSDSLFAQGASLSTFLQRPLQGEVLVINRQHEGTLGRMPASFRQKLKEAEGIVWRTEYLTFGASSRQEHKPRWLLSSKVLRKAKDGDRISFRLQPQLQRGHRAYNLLGYVPGKVHADSFVVFTAHYDHLGQIGGKRGVFYPGGNDNASGVAAVLALASHFRQYPPDCSVAFMFFSGEELGLLGSKYYVEHPVFPLSQIRSLINLDLWGTGEQGGMVVGGSVFPELMWRLQQANRGYLPSLHVRGKAPNSDHYFFGEAGVPAVFVYLMGNGWKHYHVPKDDGKVPLSHFDAGIRWLIDYVSLPDGGTQ